MLEQYIRNFARDHLWLSGEYLDKIESDEGLYVISINDTLLCTVEELDSTSTGITFLDPEIGIEFVNKNGSIE